MVNSKLNKATQAAQPNKMHDYISKNNETMYFDF